MDSSGPDAALCIAGCIGLCSELLRRIQQDDILAVPTETCTHQSRNRSTVGIMLSGTTIDQMVVGGPAYNCGQLERGDVIVEVDGQTTSSDNVLSALLGADIPGTSFTVSVRKSGAQAQGAIKTVTLTRMATETIADRRQMFELFTTLKDRARTDRDTAAATTVDACIELWTKMLLADAAHDRKVVEDVQLLQRDCTVSLSQLAVLLDRIQSIMPPHSSPPSSPPPIRRGVASSPERAANLAPVEGVTSRSDTAAAAAAAVASAHQLMAELASVISEAGHLREDMHSAAAAVSSADQLDSAVRCLGRSQAEVAALGADLSAAREAARRAQQRAEAAEADAADALRRIDAAAALTICLDEILAAAADIAVAANVRCATATRLAERSAAEALVLRRAAVTVAPAGAPANAAAADVPHLQPAQAGFEARDKAAGGGGGGRWGGLSAAIEEVERLRARMDGMVPLEPTDEACWRARSRLLASLC